MRVLPWIGLLLALPLQIHAGQPSTLVGTWEMVRVDGVEPRDIPPWGFLNMLVEFGADGVVERWTPGEKGDARGGRYVWSETDSTLVGWIGLSNDVETPRAIRFDGGDWLEITLPEGYVATFERIDTAPTEARCIFFTIVGQNHDPEFVRDVKKRLFAFRPEVAPAGLAGTWINTLDTESDGAWLWTLQIAGTTAAMTVRSLEYADIVVDELGGTLEVSGSLLRSPALYCGALSSFELSEDTLIVSPDGANSATFTRVLD